MPSPIPPARTPTAVTPPVPVGSSATISIGSSTHKHQLMQQKLDVAKQCRAAACKPNNTNMPAASETLASSSSSSSGSSSASLSSSSSSWH